MIKYLIHIKNVIENIENNEDIEDKIEVMTKIFIILIFF